MIALDHLSQSPSRPIFVLSLLVLIVSITAAQQPFVIDDADTTTRSHFHFEFSNEFDLLQRSSYPSRKQNTADFELDYGLFDRVETGIESPLLTILNADGTTPQTVSGIGDTNLSLKYNFLRERENSRQPALAIAFNLELPTGDTSRNLGSGLEDFYMNYRRYSAETINSRKALLLISESLAENMWLARAQEYNLESH